MFSAAALAELGKWLFSKLTLRNILYLILLVFAIYGGWKTYNWIYDRGASAQAAIDKPIIDGAVKTRDEAVATKNEYVAAYNKHVAETKEANARLKADNEATVKKLSDRLAKAEADAKRKQGLLDAIPKYIPPSADPVLPVGFVSLWNLSLEGSAPGADASVHGISGGPGEGNGAPSGITLSEYAYQVGIPNNVEAVQRGVIIRSWQTWYEETKQQFTEAQRKKAEAIPRIPADGKGDGRAPTQ